jgi:hypothetical protein
LIIGAALAAGCSDDPMPMTGVDPLLDDGASDEAAADEGGTSATPSAGCALAMPRPADGQVIVDNEYIYQFPPSYDGSTPLPLVFAFHANANPNTQLRDATRGTALESDFVMAFPKSTGMGWAIDVDGSRFDAFYQDLVSNYCVDTNRVFAMGHSSGAQFIEQLLCRGATPFRAVVPSAGAKTCESWAPIDTLWIHGQNDSERANSQDADGQVDLTTFVSSNACEPSTAPFEAAACMRDGVPVNAGCQMYSGCSATTIACHHDDPNYGGTNHGWPCFASQTIASFFGSYR